MICYVPMTRDNVDWVAGAPSVTGTTVTNHPPIIYPPRLFIVTTGAGVPDTIPFKLAGPGGLVGAGGLAGDAGGLVG